MNYRGAFVGQEGSGKTTLMERLVRPLHEKGFRIRFLLLKRGVRKFPAKVMARLAASLRKDEIIFLDGAEQMGWLAWRRFRKLSQKAGGLVISSHRHGLLPTIMECHTSPELLKEIAAELAGYDIITDARAEKIYNDNRGNIREALLTLYDMVAEKEV
ncbi:MAG: hypothetical protein JXQ25_07195 [Deltaproteobacteria bacterium]|nr:hypothetical protein [Deltaproteobacteria bacterium]